MGKIIILDENTANQIAAGEVVERPASVVKELVENSIDAGATTVNVEIINGGTSQIRISDNGSGMSCDDLSVAFERHSTSKIRRLEDLDTISDFGFRGEALASIASVSRVTMTSREKNSESGNEINIEGGKIIDIKTSSCNYGTTITIKDLFFNVPARFKFLKTDATEASHVSDIIIKLALANPSISFTYSSNRKNLFRTPGNDDLKSTIYALYGKALASDLLQVDFSDDGYRVHGYIGKDTLYKRNRDTQMIFVNKRYIRSRLFNYAIDKAYDEHMLKGRYPVIFLNISMDPAQLDINVHPQKLEARFYNEKTVFNLLTGGILDSLLQKPVSYEQPAYKKTYIPVVESKKEAYATQEYTKIIIPNKAKDPMPVKSSAGSFTELVEDAVVIGQVFSTYILLEKNDSLILMDQHAAHERINYEYILKMRRSGTSMTQELLSPFTIVLSNQETVIVNTNLDLIAKTGFEIEAFGENTYMIRGIPSTCQGMNLKEAFLDIIDQIRNHNYEPTDENIALIACKSSIKGNKKLDNKEASYIIERLKETQNPLHCPHGRPILHIITKKDLERIFQR